MRLWIAMMLGCCAMAGYAQDGAPEEVVVAEETSEEQEAAPAEAHKEAPTKGGCGCGGKPK